MTKENTDVSFLFSDDHRLPFNAIDYQNFIHAVLVGGEIIAREHVTSTRLTPNSGRSTAKYFSSV